MDHLRAKLTRLFPYQFRYLDQQAFSFSLPRGWRDLFTKLCADVNAQLSPEEKDVFRWIQIKEKFGTLRAYHDFRQHGRAQDATVVDPHVSKHKHLNGVDQETRDCVKSLVEAASDLSGRTCVFCGESGEMRIDQEWVHPTCVAHINSTWREFPNGD